MSGGGAAITAVLFAMTSSLDCRLNFQIQPLPSFGTMSETGMPNPHSGLLNINIFANFVVARPQSMRQSVAFHA